MHRKKYLTTLFICIFFILIFSCTKVPEPPVEQFMQIQAIRIGTKTLNIQGENVEISVDKPIVISFNTVLDKSSVDTSITITDQNSTPYSFQVSYLDQDKTISLTPDNILPQNTTFTLEILPTIKGINNESFIGLTTTFTTLVPPLLLNGFFINDIPINTSLKTKNINRNPVLRFEFSSDVDIDAFSQSFFFSHNSFSIPHKLIKLSSGLFEITPSNTLEGWGKFNINILNTLKSVDKNPFNGFQTEFYTELDSSLKFPEITDDELLTLVQQQTFNYFWDFGHPVSGLSRERNNSGDLVTTGGSGFGVMSIIVGVERGFITKSDALIRWNTIVDFLTNKADRFHGAWPHWLNGISGNTIPFSTKDNGGDLVETSFLAMGLITLRQYLNPLVTEENNLILSINNLLDSIEWDWYTKGGENVLYWHWSPNYHWDMNMQIRGYNEALITYIMATSSSNYSISKPVYDNGWTNNGGFVNGNSYYGITLPLGPAYGGPLFFSHYSFLGLDPRNLSDSYVDYWSQNVNHTLINQQYCIVNPNNYVGYTSYNWGLTASDNFTGYSAHSPTNDLGVITPTAALSSFPYTPTESMKALKHFYYILGDKLWGDYGFYDAFSIEEGWYANSYLAIDQGPIIIMIENYRTGLLWNLFMSAPEIQSALTKLEINNG